MCNMDNIENKIKWILDINNKELVNNMRKLGMELVRNNHTTNHRSEKFNNIVENNYFIYNENKYIFSKIYENNIWNNGDINIPLSGPGSSLKNTTNISKMLNDFIYNQGCKTILDLGCGDLNWISKTPFFNDDNIKYTGIDVVESLISSHLINYPNKHFLCKDITVEEVDNSDLIIIRDVTFLLKNKEVLSIFDKIKNKFKFLVITSNINMVNSDVFDKWHYTEKNINIAPFNKSSSNIQNKLYESEFNRNVYFYTHECFYN